MQLEGNLLLAVIEDSLLKGNSSREVEVRNCDGRLIGKVSASRAKELAETGRYAGIGSRHHIRYLREISRTAFRISAEASHTTVGRNIYTREHHMGRSSGFALVKTDQKLKASATLCERRTAR